MPSPNVCGVLPFASHVPSVVMPVSGGVYYSGRDAFTGPSPLYLLGLNPGGDPVESVAHTVASHLEDSATWANNYSAYRDQSWNGRSPGTATMQPRVLHLLDRLGLDPGEVPASNLVFARSAREATMESDRMDAYADLCWPFHAAVIETLQVRVVVCFGGTVGRQVRARLGAHTEIGCFKETNNRGWTSHAHRGHSGVRVVTVSHPSIADWSNPATDVSDLVAFALAGDDEYVGPVGNAGATDQGTEIDKHEVLNYFTGWSDATRGFVRSEIERIGATRFRPNTHGYWNSVRLLEDSGRFLADVLKTKVWYIPEVAPPQAEEGGNSYGHLSVMLGGVTRADRSSRTHRREPDLPPVCMNEGCQQIFQSHAGECW